MNHLIDPSCRQFQFLTGENFRSVFYQTECFGLTELVVQFFFMGCGILRSVFLLITD